MKTPRMSLPKFANRCVFDFAGRLSRKGPSPPRAMCFFVTSRCNLRCRICGIWTPPGGPMPEVELSLEDMKNIFSDPLFRRLEFVNINGGEPNLRSDLPDIVELCREMFPRLEIVTLSTNGVPPDATLLNARRISALLKPGDISFSVSVSLHGTGDLCDDISGRRGTYSEVTESFEGLKRLRREYGFHLSANCVITRLNVFRLDDMLVWSERTGIPVNFTLGEVRERFHNTNLSDNVRIDGRGREVLIAFLRRLARSKKRFLQHALRYKHLADMIEHGRPRTLACHYLMAGLVLGSDGTLFYCKDSPAIGNCREAAPSSLYYGRENLKMREDVLMGGKCPACPPNTYNRIEMERDIWKILGDLVGLPARKR